MINELKPYTPDANKIIHATSVDINTRSNLVRPVHLVQYDDSLPIIAVTVYNSGKIYNIPDKYTSNIRMTKKDGTVIFNPALGCNAERNVLYFEVTQNMTFVWGTFTPIIDIANEKGDVAGSSAITVIIDQNPVQEDDIESSDEFKTLVEYVEDARESADKAKKSEENAKASADKAAVSEKNAQTYANSAADSMNKAATSAANAAQSAQAAKLSENEAAKSKGEAEYWNQMAESYAHGGTGRREGEGTDNAMYYSNQASNSAASADEDAASASADAASAHRYLEQTIEEGKNAMDKLNDALGLALPKWQINWTTGNLEYEGGKFIWKIMRETGHLMWELALGTFKEVSTAFVSLGDMTLAASGYSQINLPAGTIPANATVTGAWVENWSSSEAKPYGIAVPSSNDRVYVYGIPSQKITALDVGISYSVDKIE